MCTDCHRAVMELTMRPKPVVKRQPHTPCPECGAPVHTWWQDNPLDPGDVDPRADCTNPACGWGY